MAEDVKVIIGADDQASDRLRKVSDAAKKMGQDVKNSTGEAEKSTQSFTKSLDNNKEGLLAIGAASGIAFAGIAGLAKASVGAAIDFEQTEVAFTTMLGGGAQGIQNATWLLKELAEFAKKTPFELTGLQEQSKKLLAMGIQMEDLLPTLQMLGDISAGVGMDKLPQLTYALGQVRAAGKLMGGDLMQFTNAGVPLLENLGKSLGKTTGEVREMVTAGQIGFSEVVSAMELMTNEGGKFHNLMQEQSKTTGGKISNMADSFGQLKLAMGNALLPYVTALADKIGPLLSSIQNWTQENPKLAAGILAIVGGILGLVTAAAAVGLVLPSVIAGITLLGTVGAAVFGFLGTALAFLLSPIGLIVAAVALLGIAWSTNFLGIQEVTKSVWERIKGAASATMDFLKAVIEVGMKVIAGLFLVGFQLITGDWGAMRDNIKTGANAAWDAIKGGIRSAIDRISGIFSGEGREKIGKSFTGMLSQLKDIAKNVANSVIGSFESMVNGALNAINSIIAAVNRVNVASGLTGKIPTIGPISFPKLYWGGIVEPVARFASGGLVTGPQGIDQVPALLTAGEIVLNAAQQRNVAANMGGKQTQFVVDLRGANFYGDEESFAQKIGDKIIKLFMSHQQFESFTS